jgi:cytidine deaminase
VPEAPPTVQEIPPALSAENDLVFGLIGPLGVDMTALQTALTNALKEVGYSAIPQQLIELAEESMGEPKISAKGYDEVIKAKMDLGNRLREKLARPDALARVAILAIKRTRATLDADPLSGKPRRGYLLRQIKRPEEVTLLRDVYGARFFLIAGYSPREARVQYLATRIAEDAHEISSAGHRAKAEGLIERDEYELDLGRKSRFGQNVRDAFPIADVFVDANNHISMQNALTRFVHLLFGYVVHTPSRDEQGMFFAKAAAVRSASMARQVGAAITNREGDLLTIGTNEVPKAGGGLYWEGDKPDHRSFKSGSDVSDSYRNALLMDVLRVLQDKKWLSEPKATMSAKELAEAASLNAADSLMRQTRIADLLEYVREVHAEMAAITDAARRGVAVENGTLYVTTYPCHECARHLVAAGIEKVVFIEPYAKSLVAHLHPDSVSSAGATSAEEKVPFEPFVGLAPRRYIEFFEMDRDRKDATGKVVEWIGVTATPKNVGRTVAHLDAENEALREFIGTIQTGETSERRGTA